MHHWITHIVEPQRLLLTWQGKGADRMRCLVAELVQTGDKVALHYLANTLDYRKAVGMGFEGYPGYLMTQVRHADVLDTFMRRLPPRSREDFGKYLESIRIRPEATLTDFALLGYSGAKLPDDDFNIVHPFEDVSGACEVLTEVSGVRYHEWTQSIDVLQLDQPVSFMPEPTNQWDAQAIKIVCVNKTLGYVNRGQVPAFHRWLQQCKIRQAVIERKNGRPERPSVYVFVEVAG